MQQTSEDLLERARALGPSLREHAPAAEQTGRVAHESRRALERAGLLKLWRPRSLGGLEIDPLTYARVAEEIAYHDSASAWLLMVANNAAFDLRMAPQRFVEALYAAQPEALVCATFNKPLQALAADGGVVVSGTSGFASGCHEADWIGHTALLRPAAAQPRMLLTYHPRGALRILDDWDALGLRGTSSHGIAADGCFVPHERVVELGDPGPRNEHYRGPLYACPLGLLATSFPPVALGVLHAALDALQSLAETKLPFASSVPLKQRALAQLHFGRALAQYRALRAYLHAQLELTWARALAGQPFDLASKADLFLASSYALQGCADAVREVASAAGSSAVYKTCPIERALRDAETLRQHALTAEGRLVSAVQAYWGCEIDFAFLAMD